MILTVEDLKARVDCGKMTDEQIKTRLSAIEEIIRSYTHNNFQNINVRFIAQSDGRFLKCNPSFIKSGDTIQISQSAVNDGVYAVVAVSENGLTVDRDLFPVTYNKVTKIEYPADVVQCAVNMFEWKNTFGQKIGIKSESETLSRHSESVTYEDSSSMFMGYPKGILSGLNSKVKARF